MTACPKVIGLTGPNVGNDAKPETDKEGDRYPLHSRRTPPRMGASARNQSDSVEAAKVSIPAASTILPVNLDTWMA